MPSAEQLEKEYGLYHSDARLLADRLTSECLIQLSFAMNERLKRKAKKAGMTFVVVGILGDWLRVIYRRRGALMMRDIRLKSRDPEMALLEDMAAAFANVREGYIIPSDPQARPN